MAVRWTEEQQRVIDTRGCNILVSAAAGSGKTAVLVARILDMITGEKPVDIDRLLVVTFTNAAAAEMRERIRDALEQRAEEEPENEHLQRQLVLVHNAKITTIHSFCLHVLRSHFQTIGIDPAFRVADEGEVLLLEQDTAKETVDAAYEEADKDADGEFYRFLELFTTGKSDRAIEETILQIYHFALGQPWPQDWLRECRERYQTDRIAGSEDDGEQDSQEEASAEQAIGCACEETRRKKTDTPVWLAYVLEDTVRLLSDMRAQIEEAKRIAQEPDGPYPYIAALESDLELLDRLAEGGSYEGYARAFAQAEPFERLAAKRDDSINPVKKQQVQNMRGGVKEALAALRKCYYYGKPKELQQEHEKSGLVVRVLTQLTEHFMERLAQKKAEQNLVDFGDLEHLALRILVERKDGLETPTAAAREYAEMFEEIMIDEYQDSNSVQELILNSVAGKGRGAHNMFMVGDVKQSIYRFRLARPELFMEKYRTYQSAKTQSGTAPEGCRIDLHRNFRSRSQVLDGVNYVFRQIMTEHPGGIVYDEDAALYPGAEFAEGAEESFLTPELLLLESESGQRQREEAALVGRRIRQMVGSAVVLDRETGQYRPVRYGDIVILLRTVSGWAETFGEVLGDMGIPCVTGSQKGYFSAVEIRTVLAYLQILDNPIQDIPLAAVLRSAIGGFDDEELAKIRVFSQRRYYYDCCQEYRASGEDRQLRQKLERFFATFEQLRDKCAHTPVHLLLWELLDVTGYGAYAEALPAGRQRKANLDMLVEKAIAYEATSYRGLYHFVRYIENLKKYEVDYGEANTDSEAGNTVRIMSIHKSKGLEFPIVFVSGLGKQFNETDARSRLIMHPEFGIGCDYVDPELRTRRATLLKRAIRQKTIEENLGEELRVLYVAMTRAKEKLILTGSVGDLEGRMERWHAAALGHGEQLSYAWLSAASSYTDWVVPALLRDSSENAPFILRIADIREEEEEQQQEDSAATLRLGELLALDAEVCYDEAARDHLRRVFESEYRYAANAGIPGKLSVSELKKLSRLPEEEEMDQLYREETVIPLIPGFRREKEAVTGAARGTVYHAFMENLDFTAEEELQIQLEEMISCGKMSEEEAAALSLEDIDLFLHSKVGERMRRAALAGQLFRERPFVIGVPADRIRSGYSSQETVLVQGIIDAYFMEEDGIVVLDYKTDRVDQAKMLADKYKAQLDYYARALEQLTGYPVKERIIYSFHLREEILL